MFEGILTRSGREVTLHSGVPTITDLAYALAGQSRFAGHLNRWWSIAHHSMFVSQLAPTAGPEVALYGLLHDAHEAITSDVPSPFKPTTLREMQKVLDMRILDSYYPGGFLKAMDMKQFVSDLDVRALRAEARVFGPEILRETGAMTHYFDAEPPAKDIQNLMEFAAKFSQERSSVENMAQEFLKRYYELRAEVIVANRQSAAVKPAHINLRPGEQSRCGPDARCF